MGDRGQRAGVHAGRAGPRSDTPCRCRGRGGPAVVSRRRVRVARGFGSRSSCAGSGHRVDSREKLAACSCTRPSSSTCTTTRHPPGSKLDATSLRIACALAPQRTSRTPIAPRSIDHVGAWWWQLAHRAGHGLPPLSSPRPLQRGDRLRASLRHEARRERATGHVRLTHGEEEGRRRIRGAALGHGVVEEHREVSISKVVSSSVRTGDGGVPITGSIAGPVVAGPVAGVGSTCGGGREGSGGTTQRHRARKRVAFRHAGTPSRRVAPGLASRVRLRLCRARGPLRLERGLRLGPRLHRPPLRCAGRERPGDSDRRRVRHASPRVRARLRGRHTLRGRTLCPVRARTSPAELCRPDTPLRGRAPSPLSLADAGGGARGRPGAVAVGATRRLDGRRWNLPAGER